MLIFFEADYFDAEPEENAELTERIGKSAGRAWREGWKKKYGREEIVMSF